MSRRVVHREIPEAHRASEHLDNERTFLAWVRTNIALIGLGFVMARLSPTLETAGASNASRIVSKAAPAMAGPLRCAASLRRARHIGPLLTAVLDRKIEAALR